METLRRGYSPHPISPQVHLHYKLAHKDMFGIIAIIGLYNGWGTGWITFWIILEILS